MEVTILNPLKRKQKVIATIDLPGVPEGTEGKSVLQTVLNGSVTGLISIMVRNWVAWIMTMS